MRMIGGFFFALLLLGGFVTRPGGGLASPDGGNAGGTQATHVAAAPRDVMAAVRDSLEADGLDIVSRADDGDRLRVVIPSTAFAGDPEFAALSRYGDMIITAHVGSSEAEVTTGFALIGTQAHYRIIATPAGDKASNVTMEARAEEGTGRDSRRVARGLRNIIDRSGRELLDRVTAAAG